MKFLKAHGRFIAVLVVLMVILWIANGQFEDQSERIKRNETQARTLLSTNYRALFQDAAKFDGEPATVQGRRIQDRIQNVSHIGEARAQQMTFETAPEYRVSAVGQGASPGDMFSYYQRKHLELERELGFKRYVILDVRSESAFGFRRPDGSQPSTEAQVAQFLRNLDIVRTVALSVESTGVQRLTGFNFRSVNEPLAARGVPTRPVGTDEPPYMSGEGLEITVEGTEESIYNLLIELQRPVKGDMRNRYLAVETFELEKPDLLNPRTNLINAKILVVAYRVNEDSSYPVDQEVTQREQPTTRGPRTFR